MINPKLYRVLEKISNFRFDNSFHLVGGTALQYQINHRESFDIDLATTESDLNRCEVARLISYLEQAGMEVIDVLPETAIEEWENAGLDLRDSHQSFLVDGVKLDTFTIQGSDYEKDILRKDESKNLNNIKIASPSAVFELKSLLLLKRHKSRDNFDLYSLVNDQGFETSDILETIRKYQPHNSLQKAVNNLASSKYPLDDEPLGSDIKVSLDEIRDFFKKELVKISRNSELKFDI